MDESAKKGDSEGEVGWRESLKKDVPEPRKQCISRMEGSHSQVLNDSPIKSAFMGVTANLGQRCAEVGKVS